MSAVARPATGERTTTRLDRVLAAVPLATVFVWACLLYLWHAWALGSPWVFSDELQYTELARSIAETGRPALRGAPEGLTTLTAYAYAPAWLLDDVHQAYTAAKSIAAVAMTLSVFPAYALARLVAGRGAALWAAGATVATPAFMYSGLLLQEPLAYTASTLAFWLGIRALARPRRGAIALAVVAALFAPLVREELTVVPLVLALAAAWLVARSDRFTAWRRVQGRRANVALLVGTVLAALLLIAAAAAVSEPFRAALEEPRRAGSFALWAFGALAIGLGLLPAVIALAVALSPGWATTPERRVFLTVLLISVAAFGAYTAVKGLFLAHTFATLVLERNVIYLAPLLLVAMAAWLERPTVRPAALAAAVAAVAAPVLVTPIQLDDPYFEAPGFGIALALQRGLGWSTGAIEAALLVALAVGAVLVATASRLHGRRPRWTGALTALGALAVVVCSLTALLAAAAGSRRLSDEIRAALPANASWIDAGTGGRPAFYLGQRMPNANPIWLLEFWNRSIDAVWSLDGTAPGPGPTVTPNVTTVDGILGAGSDFPFVVADGRISLDEQVVRRRGSATLYRVRPPLRVRSVLDGVDPDGWMGDRASYSTFATPGTRPGTLRVTVTGRGWTGPSVPRRIRLTLGTLAFRRFGEPALGEVTARREWTLRGRRTRTFSLATPPPPFRLEIASQTFVPADVDPRSADHRQLGAQVDVRFAPRRG